MGKGPEKRAARHEIESKNAPGSENKMLISLEDSRMPGKYQAAISLVVLITAVLYAFEDTLIGIDSTSVGNLKSPRKALMLSLLPTTIGVVGGSVLAFASISRGISTTYGGPDNRTTRSASWYGLATGLSVGHLSVVVGPGIGHWYAGNRERAIKASLARLGLTGSQYGLIFLAIGTGMAQWDGLSFVFLGGAIASGLGSIILAVVDIVKAPQSALKANGNTDGQSIRLYPLYRISNSGMRSFGAGLEISW